MATYYVERGAGGTGDGSSWANAYTTLQAALTARTGDGDIFKVDKDHYDAFGSDTTITIGNNCSIIVCDKDNSDALAVMDGTNAYLGHTSSNFAIVMAGAYFLYVYGLALRISGSTGDNMTLVSTDGSTYVYENCKFWITNTAIGSRLITRVAGLVNATLRCIGCEIRFGNASQGMSVNGEDELYGCTISSSGTAPTVLVLAGNYAARPRFYGCDLSFITGTLIGDQTNKYLVAEFVNCKLGSGVTYLATQTLTNGSGGEVFLYNCSSADEHYHLIHYSQLGKTIVNAATYCNDNIADINLSWYVESTASATFYNPYISPWIDVYNADTSTSVTPYLEGLRASDSDADCNTVAQDDEIWSEWSEQDTSGYPLATIVRDRMTLLGTAADQTSTKATTDWTIAAANDAYKSCFKLAAPAAVTANEVGHVRARVCVGIASKGFFIDPQIRGLA